MVTDSKGLQTVLVVEKALAMKKSDFELTNERQFLRTVRNGVVRLALPQQPSGDIALLLWWYDTLLWGLRFAL